MEKSSVIKKLEDEGIITDMATVCPHCGVEVTPEKWQLGCCGDSSDNFVEGYLFIDGSFMTEDEINSVYKSGEIH